jgi:hypothetical protein
MNRKVLALLGSMLILTTQVVLSEQTDSSTDTLPCFRGSAYLLYTSNWHMMEDIFITQPQEKVSRWLGMGGFIKAASAGTGIAGYFGSKKFINYLNGGPGQGRVVNGRIVPAAPYPFLDTHKTIISVGAGLLSAYIAYRSLRTFFLEREEINQLKRLLRQWPEVSELCPQELHGPLNKLSRLTHSKEYRDALEEAIRLIKGAIHAHFGEKYASENRYFDRTHLNVNLNLDLYKIAKNIYRFFF